ncbi:MAG TPA: NF038122 family metalloprotease [Rhodopila sp.]|nr:NF038122 family metalloprotease [Rhodopila sp.]
MKTGVKHNGSVNDQTDANTYADPLNSSDTTPNWAAPPVRFLPWGSAGQTALYAPDGGSAARPSKGGTGTSTTTTPGATTVTASTSPFVINITWDSSVASAPSAFKTAVISAAQYLESQFIDPITINISVGYGEVNGAALGSNALGSSQSYLNSFSYSTLRTALSNDATSAADASAVASLPTASPVAGTFWTTTAQAKALGLTSATSTATDGFIGFSSSLPFTYSTSSGIAAGTYDFNGVALHEMTEVMGRLLLTGSTIGSTANSYDVLDLFHYSAAGVRDFSASTAGYFSANGGTTNGGTFNTTTGGDPGDWASSMGYNALDAFSSSGVVNPMTAGDLQAMDVIGWNQAGVSTPTGVSIAAVTSGLSTGQTSTGLAGNLALAKIIQVGGSSADTYSYALSGANTAAFTLNTASNVATLAVGSAGLAGAAGGQLYALDVTATDTTAGTSSPAKPLHVIVASSGADTVNVATLTGSLGLSTPSFVYGLAGSDTLNGTSMAGNLWLDGGVGADKLTGGTGVNDYLYTSTSDSTSASMDIITNFHTATDRIDLTGLGHTLKYAGKLGKTKLAAGSVGWQTSGGNTYLYVNTSTGAENLSATNMKIELAGSLSLTSGNILHL